jgi:hypothetical protein
MNAGDWVEHNTALVEDTNGTWKLLYWEKERERLGFGALPSANDKNPFLEFRSITENQIRLFQHIWPGKALKKTIKHFRGASMAAPLDAKTFSTEKSVISFEIPELAMTGS